MHPALAFAAACFTTGAAAAELHSVAGRTTCADRGTYACSLNGDCVNQACECDLGWKGDSCGELDLNPVPIVAYGYDGLTSNTSSWGGGPPVFDGTKWHLFVSEIAGHCGMGTWDRMSQAVHAVSDSVEGPFKRVALVIPTQTHNTYYAYSAPDMMHLIYSIFSGTSPESCNPYKQCTDGTTPGHGGGVQGLIHMRRHLVVPQEYSLLKKPHSQLLRLQATLAYAHQTRHALTIHTCKCPMCAMSANAWLVCQRCQYEAP